MARAKSYSVLQQWPSPEPYQRTLRAASATGAEKPLTAAPEPYRFAHASNKYKGLWGTASNSAEFRLRLHSESAPKKASVPNPTARWLDRSPAVQKNARARIAGLSIRLTQLPAGAKDTSPDHKGTTWSRPPSSKTLSTGQAKVAAKSPIERAQTTFPALWAQPAKPVPNGSVSQIEKQDDAPNGQAISIGDTTIPQRVPKMLSLKWLPP